MQSLNTCAIGTKKIPGICIELLKLERSVLVNILAAVKEYLPHLLLNDDVFIHRN